MLYINIGARRGKEERRGGRKTVFMVVRKGVE